MSNKEKRERIIKEIGELEEEVKDLKFKMNDKLYSIKELEVKLEKLKR